MRYYAVIDTNVIASAMLKWDSVPGNILELLLEAGRIAPTACSYQPQRILVIEDETALGKLKQCTSCHFDAGAETGLIQLSDLSFSGCRSCFACIKSGSGNRALYAEG